MDSSSTSKEKEDIVEDKEKIDQDPIDDEDNNDDIMLDIDVVGDDLLFSDDPFPSLPEYFPSPSASSTSLLPKNPNSLSLSSSSSSSSSSSPWSFLNHPKEANMHPQDPTVGPTIAGEAPIAADIFGDIDLWDPSSPPDPSLLFHEDYDQQVPNHHVLKGDHENTDVNNCQNPNPNPNSHDDQELSKIFLDWLKSNKDSISPEDLRAIKLKTSTVECAAARLGGGKQGKVQLLKLILTWVQNHHLQKKKRSRSNNYNGTYQGQPPYPHYQFGPAYPNPNPSLDYNYPVEPLIANNVVSYAPPLLSRNAQPPQPPPPTMYAPYGYYMGTSGVMINNQPFSPSADLHTFSPHPIHPTITFHGTGLPHVLQYSGGYNSQYPMCPSSSLAGASLATKEARKKRMARQRRCSTLHQHRLQIQNQHLREKESIARPVRLGSSSSIHNTTNHNNNSKNWGSWSGQKNLSADASPSSVTSMQQRRNVGPSEKRQVLKSEKNLKFLLQKVLKQSDVGSLGRIVLPKKEAEIHLPELDTRDGIPILMEDIGTSRVWNMRYRFWPNNKSRMYLLENTGDFVRSNGLQEGDFIVIYSDVKCNKYMIRGVKVRQPVEPKGAVKRKQNAVNSDQAQASSSTSKTTTACSSSLFEDNENNMGELPQSEDDGDVPLSKAMADDI